MMNEKKTVDELRKEWLRIGDELKAAEKAEKIRSLSDDDRVNAPGPWVARPIQDNGWCEVVDRDLALVCSLYGTRSHAAKQATAHLISAAPELSEALQNLLDYVRAVDLPNVPSPLLEQSEAALAKVSRWGSRDNWC